jgi:hypothetical protein
MADKAPTKEFDPTRVKALRIKTGVVKRTGKEKIMYRKEADKEREKVEKMKKEGKDDADVNKMIEVSAICSKEHSGGRSGQKVNGLGHQKTTFIICLVFR